jgi:hypothetical protein
MYIGDTTDAPPTPMPPMNRKNRNEYRDHDQHGAPPQPVGRVAGHDRTGDRAEQRGGHREPEPERAELVNVFQPVRGTGDHRRIEPEQQAAQGRDDRAAEKVGLS